MAALDVPGELLPDHDGDIAQGLDEVVDILEFFVFAGLQAADDLLYGALPHAGVARDLVIAEPFEVHPEDRVLLPAREWGRHGTAPGRTTACAAYRPVASFPRSLRGSAK